MKQSLAHSLKKFTPTSLSRIPIQATFSKQNEPYLILSLSLFVLYVKLRSLSRIDAYFLFLTQSQFHLLLCFQSYEPFVWKREKERKKERHFLNFFAKNVEQRERLQNDGSVILFQFSFPEFFSGKKLKMIYDQFWVESSNISNVVKGRKPMTSL